MKGYITNIEKSTLENENFRTVLYTTKQSQLVLMAIQVGDDIGAEVHPDHDQFIRIEAGVGEVVIDGEHHTIEDGSAFVIPAGAQHNIINTSASDSLKLYTIYCPPEHKDGVVHATKADALAGEEHFDGITSE